MFDTVGSGLHLHHLHVSLFEKPFRLAPKLLLPSQGSHPVQFSMSYPISAGGSHGLPGAPKLKSHQEEGKASKSHFYEKQTMWHTHTLH